MTRDWLTMMHLPAGALRCAAAAELRAVANRLESLTDQTDPHGVARILLEASAGGILVAVARATGNKDLGRVELACTDAVATAALAAVFDEALAQVTRECPGLIPLPRLPHPGSSPALKLAAVGIPAGGAIPRGEGGEEVRLLTWEINRWAAAGMRMMAAAIEAGHIAGSARATEFSAVMTKAEAARRLRISVRKLETLYPPVNAGSRGSWRIPVKALDDLQRRRLCGADGK